MYGNYFMDDVYGWYPDIMQCHFMSGIRDAQYLGLDHDSDLKIFSMPNLITIDQKLRPPCGVTHPRTSQII